MGTYLGELFLNSATAYGWSSDPSIGLVIVNTFGISFSTQIRTPGILATGGGFSAQPLAPGLTYAIGGNAPYRTANSDNVIFTSRGVISNTGSTGTGTSGNGSSSTGSGSAAGGNSNAGNNSTPFTLTLTADYAGNDLTTADKEISLTPDKTNPININFKSTGVFKDWIGSTDPVDLYRFQVNTPRDNTHSGANVSIKVSGLPAGVMVSVVKMKSEEKLTYNTQTVSWSWIGILGEADSLSKPTDYYIKITSTVDTNYTLNVDLTETPLTTNLTYTTTGETKFLTNLWKFDANGKTSTVGIDPTKPTVVIIHGWNKSGSIEYGTGDSLADLAKTIATQYATEQVLALDWGEAATDKGLIPLTAAGRIKGVATWTKDELTALGFNFSKLTLIGHSLGSYVAAAIGVLGDKVGSLYALDPAGDPLSLFRAYNLDSANKGNQVIPAFKSAALRSYAFYSSYNPFAGGIADSRLKAKTADQAFALTYTGDTENNFNPIARSTLYHFAGINVFADLVSQQLFLIDPSNNLTLTNPRSLRKKKGSFNIKRPDNSGLIDKLTYMIA